MNTDEFLNELLAAYPSLGRIITARGQREHGATSKQGGPHYRTITPITYILLFEIVRFWEEKIYRYRGRCFVSSLSGRQQRYVCQAVPI